VCLKGFRGMNTPIGGVNTANSALNNETDTYDPIDIN